MSKLTIDISFRPAVGEAQSYTKSLDAEPDLKQSGLDFLAAHLFRNCHVELLFTKYRQALPDFRTFFRGVNMFPSRPEDISDLARWAAHSNTAETWLQIQNTFSEAAYLLAQSRAYKDIELEKTDEEPRLLIHLTKLQFFNLATHLICKLEDWFLLLLFVNSRCSLIPSVDVHKPGWLKDITRTAIGKGLKLRRSERRLWGWFRKTNSYLDALSDEDYRIIRTVFNKLGKPRSVRVMREYRNEIAHRGVPAVDYPFFSPKFSFPKKEGHGISLGIAARTKIDYEFLGLYEDAIAALKHLETQFSKIKAIPAFAMG